MEQAFVKDANLTMKDIISSKIGELGENIVVRRFTRFAVGEGEAATGRTRTSLNRQPQGRWSEIVDLGRGPGSRTLYSFFERRLRGSSRSHARAKGGGSRGISDERRPGRYPEIKLGKPRAATTTASVGVAGPGHNAWMMISAALVLFMTLPGLALFLWRPSSF